MKKVIIVICTLLSLFSLSSFMGLANEVILHQLNPRNGEGFYESLTSEIRTVDISDINEFIDVVIDAATSHQVIIYSRYTPLNSNIDNVYLFVPNALNDEISFYIPTNEIIDFSSTFIINKDNGNTLLFNEQFFLPSNVEIKSVDQIPRDELDFFWNLTMAGYQSSIDKFKQTVNEYYEKPMFEYIEFQGGIENSLNFFVGQFFKNDGSLVIILLIFLLFVSVVIINHSKNEISVLKVVGKSDFYITFKLIRSLFFTSFFVTFIIFIIVNIIIIKRIDQLALILFVFQLILLSSLALGYLMIYILSLIYIKTVPILDSIRKKNNSKTIYYMYSIVKIAMLVLLVPACVDQLFWTKRSITPYLHINDNYNFYSSISYFAGFTGVGEPEDSRIIHNEFQRIYDEYNYHNLFRMQTNYSESGVPILRMDSKTAEFLNIPCKSVCTVLPNKNNTSAKSFSNDDFTFHLREYQVKIIDNDDSTMNYYVMEEVVGSINNIKEIVSKMPEEVQSLFNVRSQKASIDDTLAMYERSFTKSLISLGSMIFIILLVNLCILNVYYFSHKRRLCVQYLTGRKTSSIILELFFEQFWIDCIAFLLMFNHIMDLSSFIFLALLIIFLEAISISWYISYMIKSGLKGELR